MCVYTGPCVYDGKCVCDYVRLCRSIDGPLNMFLGDSNLGRSFVNNFHGLHYNILCKWHTWTKLSQLVQVISHTSLWCFDLYVPTTGHHHKSLVHQDIMSRLNKISSRQNCRVVSRVTSRVVSTDLGVVSSLLAIKLESSEVTGKCRDESSRINREFSIGRERRHVTPCLSSAPSSTIERVSNSMSSTSVSTTQQ